MAFFPKQYIETTVELFGHKGRRIGGTAHHSLHSDMAHFQRTYLTEPRDSVVSTIIPFPILRNKTHTKGKGPQTPLKIIGKLMDQEDQM